MRVALMLLLVFSAVAHATPSEDFDKAREAFRTGRFKDAREKLNDLLYPTPKLARPDELAEAYIALGVCRLETGDNGGAKREFEQALALDPNQQIDPFVVTDKEAIRLFDATKTEIKIRQDKEAERKHRAELRKIKESMVGFQQNWVYFNFIPFGAGQFQNHQTAKGIAFAAAEGVTLTVSASIWGYLAYKYGVNSTHVPLADGPNVLTLERFEVVAGGAFIGLAIIGTIDAFRHYTPQTRAALDESMLPPELRNLDKPDAKSRSTTKPKPTSLLEHLVPMITPTSAGIGLAWEN